MTTEPTPVQDLQPGDEYVIRTIRQGGYESRTVLGILQRTPLGGALLEVVDTTGNVFRSHSHGSVDRITSHTIGRF